VRKAVPSFLVAAFVLGACASAELGSGGEARSDVVESAPADEEVAAEEVDVEPEPKPEPEPEQEPDIESEAAAAQADIEVVDYGFSTFETSYDDSRRASWAVELSNPNSDSHIAESIDVTVTLLDASGSVLNSDSHSIAVLLPGQTAAVAGSTYEDVGDVAEMRVQARPRGWAEEEGPFGGFTTSDVNARADEYGGWTVTGQVESTFTEDFEDVYAVAVLKNAAGDIVGGDFTFLDFVPADGDTSFQVSVMDDIDDVASAEVYVTLSNLSLW
jgi:hypothetical protein